MKAIIFIVLFMFISVNVMAKSSTIYSWDESSQTKREISKQIDIAAKEFNFAIRSIARGRLRTATLPYKELLLEINGDKIIFERNGEDRVEATINGKEVKWKECQVSFKKLENGSIVQTFTAEDGSRENTYTFGTENGQKYIKVKVVIKSKKIKNPITYTMKLFA